MKRLAILAALTISACAGVTTKQRLYETLGGYQAVAESAAEYAEGPTADPAVVKRLSQVVQSEPVTTALTYAKAYVACQAKNDTTTPLFNCALFNFSDASVRGYAITLRSAILQLRTKP